MAEKIKHLELNEEQAAALYSLVMFGAEAIKLLANRGWLTQESADDWYKTLRVCQIIFKDEE